jgi:hypothetical protein
MSSVFSLLMLIGVLLIPVLLIISLGILISSRHKAKNQLHARSLADPTLYPWNAKHGPWYFGNWGVNNKINETISQGRQQRYPHGSQHRQAKRRQH